MSIAELHRLKALEQKVAELEKRIAELELARSNTLTLPKNRPEKRPYDAR
jgi:hypothetical protein